MTERPNTEPRSWSFGLRGKLMLSHLAVIAAAMTIAGVALLSLVRNYLLDATQASLQTQADLIAAALFSEAEVEVQPPEPDPAFNTLQQQQIANLAVQVENQPPAAEGVGGWLDGYLFALSGPIYAGTNEIQRNVIAERILGLPRK